MEGRCDLIETSFREKVYHPLGFDVVARSAEDVPSDAHMVDYLGKLVKQL